MYLATYVCILVFIILSILLYKTRFGLRLRACGENPQAADSLGINVPFEAGSAPSSTPCGSDVRQAAAASRALAGQA